MQLPTQGYWIAQAGLGLLAYAIGLLLLRAMTRNEVTHIWQYLKRLVHLGNRAP
jgi:hypothetical protein